MPIIGQLGRLIGGSQFGGGYTTPGFTTSMEMLSGTPVNISVETALTRVAAAESIIGVASVRSASPGVISFGIPETWTPVLFASAATSVVIGFTVSRGAAAGYAMVNFW